jgi:uncharacterized protein (TIGR04255 family)
MARVRHLRNAPITEAVIDFRVSPSKDLLPDRLREARELLKGDYPRASEPRHYQASLHVSAKEPEKAESTTRELGFRGVWLRTEDQQSIAQFRVDGFTFNRLRPYTRWEEILPEALRLWNIYLRLASPRSITRLALRYINHMSLPGSGPRFELEEYITIAPRLPQLVPDLFSSFTTRILLAYPERRMHANVALSTEVALGPPARFSLLFDIDAFSGDEMETTSVATIQERLAGLRDYKNGIFFGSLTEKLVETFE